MFSSLIKIVTAERSLVTPSEPAETKTDATEEQKQTTVKYRFQHDITALKDAGYSLTPNTEISLSLKEALILLPRDRKRVDSYKSLANYLLKEYGVKLSINSQKTKQNED